MEGFYNKDIIECTVMQLLQLNSVNICKLSRVQSVSSSQNNNTEQVSYLVWVRPIEEVPLGVNCKGHKGHGCRVLEKKKGIHLMCVCVCVCVFVCVQPCMWVWCVDALVVFF